MPRSIRHATDLPRSGAAGILMVLWALSGFSMLTLEMVWMREIAVRAGNTAVASTLVIAVFFAAAALGNLFGARLVAGRERPLIWYGRFEVLAGVSAIAMFAMGRWWWGQAGWMPEHFKGALAGAVLLAGPASFFSGVAFPSLAEAFVPQASERTSRGGRFYGMNLIGAALGVVAGGVWLPWWIGIKGAFLVAVAAQVIGGLLAWRMAKSVPLPTKNAGVKETAAGFPSWLGWVLLAGSGVLSLAAQTLLIMWVRQVLEGSIYAVCGVLATFIGGLGLGSLTAAALRRRGFDPMDLLAVSAGAGALLLFIVPPAGAWLCLHEVHLSSDTPAVMMAAALGWCAAALLPLTFFLGGIFPVAWELVRARAPSEGRFLGGALALNKLGAAAGAAAALFIVLPVAGLMRGTQVIAWGYVAVALLPLIVMPRWSKRQWLPPVLAVVMGVWQSMQPETVLGLKSDLRLVTADTGPYGPVAVVEDAGTGSRHILLNTRQILSGTRGALSSQRHQSWVPLLFCRKPDTVVTIGMAAGISAAAALDLPVRELHSIELVPEVVRAAREHFGEWNAELFSDPRSHVIVGDGRLKLAQRRGGADAIICDLFFPAEEGSALLYSREFFQTARSRLNAGGVFCMWLPCYQHTPQTAGMILRTFAGVFPHAVVVRAGFDPLSPVIGLLGANEPLPFSREFLAQQLATPWGRRLALESPFFRSPEHAQLLLVCDLHSATPDFSAFPPITDDHPLLAWLGSRQPRGQERLHGFPFLDWIGKRALNASHPSCDLGTTPATQLMDTIRAGNFYFAAAAAAVSIQGDRRPEAIRQQQVQGYLRQARSLRPEIDFPADAVSW